MWVKGTPEFVRALLWNKFSQPAPLVLCSLVKFFFKRVFCHLTTGSNQIACEPFIVGVRLHKKNHFRN